MKTYAIVGNEYEGIYQKPWSLVQKYTQTKPAPKYKSFDNLTLAKEWFNNQKGAGATARVYTTSYDGQFVRQANQAYIYTDGGTRNTGNHLGQHVKSTDRSAFAVAAYMGDNKTPFTQKSEGYFGRTNNDMEVEALIHGLQLALWLYHKHQMTSTIISDSKYVLDTTTDWLYSWQSANWQKKSGGEIANLASWQQVYDLVNQLQNVVSFIWVKGHATSGGNVYVDELLNQRMDELS